MNDIAQRPGGSVLHALMVNAEELQELFDPMQIVNLDMRVNYWLTGSLVKP